MQCTPESNLCPERSKGHCTDSGYSGLFHSPQSVGRADSCGFSPPAECNETPKENLRLSVSSSSRGRRKDCKDKDSKVAQQPSTTSWCETPKLYKRDSSLRNRLLMSKPVTDARADDTRSPYTRKTQSSLSATPESWLGASFDLLEDVTEASASSKRKRQVLFSQVRTSTLEDGKLNSGLASKFEGRVSLRDADDGESICVSDRVNLETPGFSPFLLASSLSPVSGVTSSLHDSSSVLCTPSYTHTPRSVSEDSGFSSLTLDKSQDSSVGYDCSFQELLLLDSRGNGETPNLAEEKRRSRLQRQRRLSTLKEGGSQSEEDPADRKHERHQFLSHSKDVFDDFVTPRSVFSLKHGSSMTFGVSSVKQDCVIPVRGTAVESENVCFSTALTNSDATPRRTTPVNLNQTPALQLVHAMCQQKAQMFVGESPSLKEQLSSTAALTETPLMFRTAMPLSGLIGRKMGIRKVDILTELRKRNLRHVLAVIFTYLTSESIHRCSQVCKCWNEIIHQDKRARFRRRNHLSEVEVTPEVGGLPYVPLSDSHRYTGVAVVTGPNSGVHVPDSETRLALLKRSALRTVQAQSRTSSYCTPQSGASSVTPLQHSAGSSKRDKFLEIAKTLFSDECLRPCPRCQHPARCHSVKGEGVCSRDNCGFKFCTACLCAFHGSRECGSQSVGRRKKDIILPGSAQSKRNVRRL